MRIELTFKENEKDLYDFIKSQAEYTTISGYIKKVLSNDMNEKLKSKRDMFSSKYEGNNDLLKIALYEGYSADSVYKLVEVLDSFYFEVKFNKHCKPIYIYDHSVNEINQNVSSLEGIFDYIEYYLESYGENCLNSYSDKQMQEECLKDVCILRKRGK